MSVAGVQRGLFGRHPRHRADKEGDQCWGPGTGPDFRRQGIDWLDRNFPRLESGDDGRGSGSRPVEEGAVWIRYVDQKDASGGQLKLGWIVCHASMPKWSRDRSIPAWALVQIPDEVFRTTACLGAVVADVLQGTSIDPSAWSSDPWVGRASNWTPTPWSKDVLPLAATVFDEVARVSPGARQRWCRLARSLLDGPGWIALQAMLVAMRDAGRPAPCAVIAREHAWTMPPAGTIPDDALVFESSELSRAAPMPASPGQPCARGVELARFVPDFAALRELLTSAVRGRPAADGTSPFLASASSAVPLGLVGPEQLDREEWRRWAAERLRASGGPDRLAAEIDALAQRAWAGQDSLVGPLVALCAAWSECPGSDRARIERWLLPAAGQPARRA